jgi:O-antigen ligase
VLPHSIRDIPYVHALVHPAVSQVQSLLGDGQNGRAAAPFPYTNTWANNISLLLVWFVCSWGLDGSAKRRWACGAVLAVSVIPIVYSLNRGLWIGIVFSVLWVAVRLFLRGKVAALLAVLAAAIAGLLAFVASPLHDTFQARLENQNSNGIRSYLSGQAVRGAIASPVLGWAGPRKTEGSDLSIAVGKTPQCQLCGAFSIGGNGQLWAVIFDRGFVGAALYFGFFAACLWLYRKDRSPPAQAATLVVALSFVYMFVYNAVPAALTLTMISIGVLWRSDEQRARRNQLALSPATTGAK